MHDSTAHRSGAVASFRCDDAQAQARLLSGWNQDYCQVSRGAFAGTLQTATIDGAFVFRESANRSLLQHGLLEEGAIGIAIPVRLAGRAKFCGHDCHAGQVYVYSGRDGFEFCSPADHAVVGIAFAPEALATIRRQAGNGFPAAWIARAGAHDVDPTVLGKVRTFALGLLEAAEAAPMLLENGHASAALGDAIVANLLELFSASAPPDTAHAAPQVRVKLVERAREHVRANAHEPVSVASLCAELGVSRRTLQYCFQDVLGVGPNTYMRAVRLNGAHEAMCTAPSVTDAAYDWGFWHLGQFAADYRKMFGELPSQTFRRLGQGSET
jgi:AraC family transcriptional regulator, ethanolamine operon transcriptional activator